MKHRTGERVHIPKGPNAVSRGEVSGGTEEGRGGPAAERPAVPYWEDPVYRYLSRRHRLAADGPEAVGTEGHMQALVDQCMSDELYWRLDAEARADRKTRAEERKRRRKPSPRRTPADDRLPSVNVSELKKRIFNPHVSRENVIKALGALPAAERRATIAGLPPGLRRKLGSYLEDGRH